MQAFIFRRAAAASVAALFLSFAPSAVQSAGLKTAHHTIDAMAMGPDGVSSDTNYAIAFTDGLRNAAPDPACFSTGVNLPNGATVTRVTVWYTAGSGAGIETALLRRGLTDGDISTVAVRQAGSTNNQRKSVNLVLSNGDLERELLAAAAPSAQQINNARYSYAFITCLTGEDKTTFHGARVTYTIAN